MNGYQPPAQLFAAPPVILGVCQCDCKCCHETLDDFCVWCRTGSHWPDNQIVSYAGVARVWEEAQQSLDQLKAKWRAEGRIK